MTSSTTFEVNPMSSLQINEILKSGTDGQAILMMQHTPNPADGDNTFMFPRQRFLGNVFAHYTVCIALPVLWWSFLDNAILWNMCEMNTSVNDLTMILY